MKLHELLEAVTPGYKIFPGEPFERPATAPLIWRAVKHATEVEHKVVWSDIPAAKGTWTIRYSVKGDEKKPISELKYFYVKVKFPDATSNWFEIIPEDDDRLEIHPDGEGGYEITNPDGMFKT